MCSPSVGGARSACADLGFAAHRLNRRDGTRQLTRPTACPHVDEQALAAGLFPGVYFVDGANRTRRLGEGSFDDLDQVIAMRDAVAVHGGLGLSAVMPAYTYNAVAQ